VRPAHLSLAAQNRIRMTSSIRQTLAGPQRSAGNAAACLSVTVKRRVAMAIVALVVPMTGHAAEPVVGQPAPDFAVTTSDGRKLSLADCKDQVLVVNY
jgi:hypothetical protein